MYDYSMVIYEFILAKRKPQLERKATEIRSKFQVNCNRCNYSWMTRIKPPAVPKECPQCRVYLNMPKAVKRTFNYMPRETDDI